jgi:hypothetical protein
MPVAISDILHVLAHELRTPVGIAHGYVRLLLDDRLPQQTDRRRALEQMQKALSRLTELSHESTALASWYEQDRAVSHVAGRTLIERIASTQFPTQVTVDGEGFSDDVVVRTVDANALSQAVVDLVRATARELGGAACAVSARLRDDRVLEILVGAKEQLPALAEGPNAANATPMVLERGGLGLALVHAAIVLDAHGAERWTIEGSRQIAGFRLPVEERPHQ